MEEGVQSTPATYSTGIPTPRFLGYFNYGNR